MDKISSRNQDKDGIWSEAKEILLYFVVFIFVLFVSHRLTMWLHRTGIHDWFWNYVLSGLVFVVVMRVLTPWMKRNRQSQIDSKNRR